MKVIREGEAAPPSELDRLADQAGQLGADIDQAGADQAGAAPAAVPLTNAQVLSTAFELVRETLCTVAGVESPRRTVSSATLAPLAEAWGAVCDKHGINLSGMVGDYILEFKALALTVPVILAARTALLAEIEQKARGADVSDVTPKPDRAESEPNHGG